MRWQSIPMPERSRPEWHSMFPMLFPIELDNGLKIIWERVYWRLTVTEEWAGMGADGWKGYTEYKDAQGNILGRIAHT
jgi:hypothetical protein